jgi:hypothetical protein
MSSRLGHKFGKRLMMRDFVLSDFVSDLVSGFMLLRFMRELWVFELVLLPFVR